MMRVSTIALSCVLFTWLLAAHGGQEPRTLPEHTGKPGYLISDGKRAFWGEMITGKSGALCAGKGCPDGIDGTVDIMTSVVPRLAAYNEFTGVNKFERLQVAVYPVAKLPKCNSAFEGQIEGVNDAKEPTYNGPVNGGGSAHIPVYCNGTNWTAH